MANGAEKKRRQQIFRAIRQQQRAEEEAAMPLAPGELEALFDFVGREFERNGCDCTPRAALAFLAARGVAEEAQGEILGWMIEHGGGCDCEIVGNVREWWDTPPR